MSFNDYLLILTAIVPAIILFVYIYKKDRVEKEPIGLLLFLFFAGIIITYPAGTIEGWLSYPINAIFDNFAIIENDTVYLDSGPYYLYHVIDNFIGVAMVEEGLKFLALFLITRNSKHFNSLFDGMIYAVVVSLGFAAFENILYAFSFGWDTVLARALTAVPAHMFFGVLMGYFYSFWNLFRQVEKAEEKLKSNGIITSAAPVLKKERAIALTLLVPVAAHGFYDFCCTVDSFFFYTVFYVFLACLYIFCFYRIHKLSKIDMHYNRLITGVILKRHPEFMSSFSDNVMSSAPKDSQEFFADIFVNDNK